MMSALTKKIKDNKHDNITIGNKSINRPNTETWQVATVLANEIYKTVVEISLGSKTKLLNKIVECKGLTAVQSLQVEQQTLKTTEKVYDILRQTKDVREQMAVSKMIKMISQKTSRTYIYMFS